MYVFISMDYIYFALTDREPKLPNDMEFEKPAEEDDNHLNSSWDPKEILSMLTR